MNPTRIVRLVVGRELMDRLSNKAFTIATLVGIVGVAALVIVPALLSDDGPERFELGVVGEVPDGFEELLTAVVREQEARVELVHLDDRDAAAEAVRVDDVDAALIDASELMADGLPDPVLGGSVDLALQRSSVAAELREAGSSDEEIARVLAAGDPATRVDPEGQQDDGFLQWILAFGSTVLLFSAIATNAGSLLSGGIEEKSNRVIEVLLGTVRPWHLLTGKILALAALALGQMGLLVGTALVANSVVGAVELPGVATALVAVTILMTLFGFVFYAALYAVAGSLAPSLEDAQAAAGPLGYTFMAAYFLVIFAVIPNPTGIIARLLTFLPPTAPFAVPARMAMGGIPAWQVVAGLAITLVGAAMSVRLSGRLYAASVLSGGRVSWREAWQGEPIR